MSTSNAERRTDAARRTIGQSRTVLPGRRGGTGAGRARLRRHGVGLVELLIALSISAAVLTAVAVATDTSFKAYGVNREQASLTQRSRITMHRLLTYIRTCREHQPVSTAAITAFAAGSVVTDTGISMFTDDGTELDFTYDASNKRIVVTEDGGTARVLLTGVEAFSVKMEPMQSADAIRSGGPYDLVRRATLLITLRTTGQSADLDEAVDGQTITLSSSVMPRRNSW